VNGAVNILKVAVERPPVRGFLAQVKDSDVYELTEGGQAFLDEYAKFKRLEDVLMQTGVSEEEVEDF